MTKKKVSRKSKEEKPAEAPEMESEAKPAPAAKKSAAKSKMVKVQYKGEASVSNRTFMVNGKPFRMEAGSHDLPKSCYEAFANTPVGKELVKRECLKVLK